MTGIARLAARDVPVVNTADSAPESQPSGQDAPSERDGAFASILARVGDGPPRTPAHSLAGSRASAHFQGGMRLAASPLENQPDAQSLREKAPSQGLEKVMSDGVAGAGLARPIGTAAGQRSHLTAQGTEDSEADRAPDDHETEVAAADVGLVVNVVFYAGESQPLEAPKSEASVSTEAPRALANDPAHTPPASNDSIPEVAFQSHGADFAAIDHVASSKASTDRAHEAVMIQNDSVSQDVGQSYGPAFEAIDPTALFSNPRVGETGEVNQVVRPGASSDRMGTAARMESSGSGRDRSPEPAIERVRRPAAGGIAVDAPTMPPPIRPLVTGRETHFAPARPVVLDPFTGKAASAETKSQITPQAEESEAPAQATVASEARDRRPAPTEPPMDPHPAADEGPRSVAEGRIAPSPPAGDDRTGSIPAASDNITPSGLPAGQLQRIADAVLAAATGKPVALPLDSAPGGTNASSQPLAEGAIRTLVIKLDPPDYGALTIRIKLTGKTMAVQFHAARSETARLLNDDRDKLSAAIETAGHDLDISIVGSAPTPAPPSSSMDQSWLPGSSGGSIGSQLANPEGERRFAPPPAHPFGDDRQFPHKDRDRDSHEAKPQDRRTGALYV